MSTQFSTRSASTASPPDSKRGACSGSAVNSDGRSHLVKGVAPAWFEAIRFRWELWNRQTTVFYIAFRLYLSIKLAQWRCDQLNMDEEEKQDAIWNETHERNAKFLVSKLVSLQGLWVKLGQMLSGRADVMPEAYLRELKQCQDTLPARPFVEIRRQIETELGAPLADIFLWVDESPLACASIGQVHRATLKSGKSVVIKVQKDKVATRMLQDVANLETISSIARALDADFDMRPLLREWSSSIPNELDFAKEAASMRRVQANFRHWRTNASSADVKVDVAFAHVEEEYVSEKVLVMSYVDGFKVDDQEELRRHEVDPEETVLQITRSLALQIFNHGFYNGDPHPGNLMVDRGSKKAVLLDFGIVKELDEGQRLSLAKLLVAAAEQDINGLLEALDGVGLKLRPEVPFDTQLLIKYFFRDAKPKEEAQQEHRKNKEEWRKKQEQHARALHVGDKVEVRLLALIPGLKISKQAEVLALDDTDSPAPTVTVRLSSGAIKTLPRANVKVQRRRSPIDAWPDCFIFFDRVTGLLRGLAASMNVSVSYLSVMTPFARAALLHGEDHAPPPVSGLDARGAVSACLHRLLASGHVLGAQVCVMQRGNAVVDVVAGHRSPYSAAHVQHDSLFNCFSVTKAVCAAAVHVLADRGLLDLSAPVSRYWPEFASKCAEPASKEGITVEHVLNHQAGLHSAGMDELVRDPYAGCDSEAMFRALEKAIPSSKPGSETQYHALTFGWLLDRIVRGAVNKTIAQVVSEELARPLGMQDEIKIGLGQGGASSPAVKDRLAHLVVHRQNAFEETARRVKAEEESEAESSGEEEAKTAFMNPTLFNAARLREASIPAANGHFTARGLATLYDALLSDAQSEDGRGLKLFSTPRWSHTVRGQLSAVAGAAHVDDALIQAGSARFGQGFSLYPRKQGAGCFGHAGVGGSVGFADPEQCLAVAITLNRMAPDNTTTKAIVHEIYSSMGLEPPDTYRVAEEQN